MSKAIIKVVFGICLILMTSSVFAAPVNIPSSVGIEADEFEAFTLKDTWMENWTEDVKCSIGVETDFLSEKNVKSAAINSPVNASLEGQFYSLKMSLSLNNTVDIYTTVGSTNGFEYSYNNNTTYSFLNSIVYGGGITIQFANFSNGFKVFGDARYRAIDELDIEEVSNGGTKTSYSDATRTVLLSEYGDWHGALGLSREFKFKVSGRTNFFVIYSGIKYSGINMASEVRAVQSGVTRTIGTGRLTPKDSIGGFIGFSLLEGVEDDGVAYNTFDVQAHFIDELALNVSYIYKF